LKDVDPEQLFVSTTTRPRITKNWRRILLVESADAKKITHVQFQFQTPTGAIHWRVQTGTPLRAFVGMKWWQQLCRALLLQN
jgi:hypothetical protein